MSQSPLAGCRKHGNWKGGWSMNTTKEKEIREKNELLEVSIGAERERYQGQGCEGPRI